MIVVVAVVAVVVAVVDRDDGPAPLVHGGPHRDVGVGAAGGRHLRAGSRGQSQFDVARHAAHRRPFGQTGQPEGRRLAGQRRRQEWYALLEIGYDRTFNFI